MSLDDDAYHELCAYTLTHGGPEFVHQYVVDAHAAQRATTATKPITIAFALVGLYLHLERGLTGRQVQKAHMALARRGGRAWPTFALPDERGAVTEADVLAAAPGPERDRAIDVWCAAAWAPYVSQRPAVEALLRQHGVA